MERLGPDDCWHSLVIQIIHHQVNIVSIASPHWLDFLLGYQSDLWRRRVSISCDAPVVMSVCVSVFRGWNVVYGSAPAIFFLFFSNSPLVQRITLIPPSIRIICVL